MGLNTERSRTDSKNTEIQTVRSHGIVNRRHRSIFSLNSQSSSVFNGKST